MRYSRDAAGLVCDPLVEGWVDGAGLIPALDLEGTSGLPPEAGWDLKGPRANACVPVSGKTVELNWEPKDGPGQYFLQAMEAHPVFPGGVRLSEPEPVYFDPSSESHALHLDEAEYWQ